MYHDTPLISTIVAGLVLAFIFGMIANRFRMPPLVGYLIAGVLVGPYTPGFVADQALGAELAEIGVILLMFGVGLHFSLKDLMSVRALAIPGALAQIAFATLLGLGLGLLMGWGMAGGLLFGLALSVASTVVLLKALQDRRLIETERGRIAVGWLIVEDLAMVLALVLIPAIAGLNGGGGENLVHDPFVSFVERILQTQVGIWGVLGLTLVKVAAFVGFMLIVGRRVIPWALHATAHTGSRELFRLAVLAIALGVALGSAVLFGVSLALGAFFAGMILSESELSQRAAQETLPLRDAFAVLFFVSVGMLFDPSIIINQPLPVLATVFIIIVGKSVAAFGIVALFRRPVGTALTISASLAQIGEFSFILASMGVSLAIMPKEAQDLILAGAIISIVLNPVVFFVVDLIRPRLEAKVQRRKADEGVRIEPTDEMVAADGPITSDAPSVAGVESDTQSLDDDDRPEPSKQVDHTVLVGFGRVGSVVGEGLHQSAAPLVVIEDADNSVAAARALGIEVVVGNAASSECLKLANLRAAKCLLIAIPNGFEAGQVVEQGRKLNPAIKIIARAHSDDEELYLTNLGADNVIMGEREIGLGMLAWLRGERHDGDAAAMMGAVEPAEPKLPPSENILERVATAPVAAVAVVEIIEPVADVVVDAGGAEPVEEAVPVAVAEAAVPTEVVEPEAVIEAIVVEPVADVEPVPAPDETAADEADVTLLPAGETLVADAVPVIEAPLPVEADPVVIDAVEGSPDPVIEVPIATLEVIPAADLESVEATPSVGEAPVEVVTEAVVADDVIILPPPAEADVELPPEPAEIADRPLEEEPEAPAEAEAPPAAPEAQEDDGTDEVKPEVPPVVPEPKI